MSLEQMSGKMHEVGRPLRSTGLHRLEHGKRRVDVDDLMALAKVLGVEPGALLTAPSFSCAQCLDMPPTGFTCQRCGKATTREQ